MSEPVPAPAPAPAASPPAEPVLRVRDLVKEYPSAAGPLRVLDGVSLDLAPGEAVAIVGPSGCGKSSLLNVVGTLEPPTAGSVSLAGVEPFRLGEAELARLRARTVGFVFQEHHLLPQCSVLENALLPVLAAGLSASEAAETEQRVRELLARVGLGERLGHRPAQLSGGERQRTAIVRALANRPVLLLADEPTGNLDRRTAETVTQVLLELQAHQRTALIVVTHSADLAAALPRRLELVEGKFRPLESRPTQPALPPVPITTTTAASNTPVPITAAAAAGSP